MIIFILCQVLAPDWIKGPAISEDTKLVLTKGLFRRENAEFTKSVRWLHVLDSDFPLALNSMYPIYIPGEENIVYEGNVFDFYKDTNNQLVWLIELS